MIEENKYQENKQKEKQKLVRNEFLYYDKSSGKYNFPTIKKQNIDIDKIQFIAYANAKLNDTPENCKKTVHFFTYDWKFDKVYDQAEKELDKLKQYYCLLSPDFSIFENMPKALQIENIFKNRWCGAYWQSKGLTVIPTVSWGDPSTFDFCFDGIEEGSIVAVSTYYRENCEQDFMPGYNEMLKRIKPSVVLCYDEPFKEMKGDIVEFLPTTYEWTKKLGIKDLLQFKWEKHNRNILGLDPKEFRYFKYEDPYAKNLETKCSICGTIALADQYGNGECQHCGWKFSVDEEDFEKKLGISYPLLVTPTTARKQYKQGLPFKATFGEFVNGLYFYSEMLFDYGNLTYEVFLKKGDVIVLASNNMQQEFKSRKDFEDNANIDGKKIKDIWNDIKNPRYMQG